MTKNLHFESGRSMVEMLGTLSIIGVLSVGGIAGYSYGIDKYKANQTINDVMLMGVDIITQISRGAIPDLSAWGTKTSQNYDFSVKQNPDDNTQYGIQISGVPSRICKMVGDGLKSTVAVYVGGEEHNPNDTGDPCDESNSNTMEFYFEPIEASFKCEPECGEGELCRWGECVSEQIEISKWLGDGDGSCTQDSDCGECGRCDIYNRVCVPSNGQNCSSPSVLSGICQWGECLPRGCTSNDDCSGENEYCASPNTSCQESFPSGTKGACVKADFKPYNLAGKVYWVTSTKVSWWDADAACRSMGFDGLIDVNDLIIGCTDFDDYKTHERTDLGKDLYNLLYSTFQRTPYVWTKSVSASCEAYVVALSDGSLLRSWRSDSIHYGGFSVCK